MASDQRSDLRYPGGGSSTLDIMTASTTSQSSTLSALATGEHNIGASSSQAASAAAPSDGGSGSDSSHAVMNDKVQALAGSVYEEFEKMISRYDRDVVKNLMPLIVNVLENLDFAITESQELEVEAELLKEDNEQLVTQYEREKNLRKATDQKLLELEDTFEVERKEATVKVGSLTSIVKMFELKAKNSQDHITRLEEKESEMKKEYSKLHERYTELFKTHIDYMERTKSILGTERLEQLQQQGGLGTARPRIAGMALNQLNRSSGPVSFGYSELENNNQQASILSADIAAQTTPGIERAPFSIKNELKGFSADGNANGNKKEMLDKESKVGGWVTGLRSPDDVELEIEEVENISGDPSIGPGTPSTPSAMNKSQTKTETRTGNNLYQELSFQDSEALGDVDEGADITGMGKEVENLITENNELLATKNALNIVKDDLIAKVDELTGEHEILREEVRSLQDVRSRLQTRISELEEELKKVKQEAEEKAKANKTEEDDDVPMAQRKRFTRVEMARVLMERNQYKERFMELQEAVRWTEMIRANRDTATTGSSGVSSGGGSNAVEKKSSTSGGNRAGIWKFFGNLFSATERIGDPLVPYVNMKYTGSEEVGPALSTMRARSSAERKNRNTDIFDGETMSTERTNQKRVNERKEQYKQVRAHVKKEDGRMQAYGWSLPAKVPQQSSNSLPGTTSPAPASDDGSSKGGSAVSNAGGSSVPVPVPVYCRPLMEKEPGMKIWCAAGVNLSGGRTKDGGDIVGASVFYHDVPSEENKNSKLKTKKSKFHNNEDAEEAEDPVAKLDQELTEGKRLVEEAERENEQEKSSHVWICTSTHAISKVTVIDANSPADVLETFQVCSSHLLCIASVPGAKESDYRVDEELNKLIVEQSDSRQKEEKMNSLSDGNQYDLQSQIDADGDVHGGGLGTISFVSCGNKEAKEAADATLADSAKEEESRPRLTKETAVDLGKEDVRKCDSTEDTDAVHRRFLKEPTEPQVKDGVGKGISTTNAIALSEVEKMSSVLPTMWLGSQSGSIYVHSAVAQWKRCIHSIRLKDSVLCIVHVKGRVMAALADGTIAIFHRCPIDGQWDLKNYHLLDLGKPHHSIRCMTQVHNKIWCGYRNKIFVINPQMMTVETTFDAHPRKESQVRQMAWIGDGVWVSIRLDSTLRLYHAHTLEHLQDVDVEPYVSKMLGTGKLGFSFVRITALLVSCNRLWMGTGNGVIISVPLSTQSATMSNSTSAQQITEAIESGSRKSSGVVSPVGEAVKVYADSHNDKLTMETFIPYCSMAQAQLSFHGHRDAVKFFVSVTGHGGLSAISAKTSPATSSPSSNTDPRSPSKCVSSSIPGIGENKSMLVMSGGEGYIDFRLVDDGSDQDHDSHIMVWHVDDDKRINKIEQKYDKMAQISPFHSPLGRKTSVPNGEDTSVTDGGSNGRRDVFKGMMRDFKDVGKAVHETATSTMSFIEHAGLTISPTSMSSSSIDVGPSPGSGLQTEVDSTEMESNQSDDEIDDGEDECDTLTGVEAQETIEHETNIEKPNFKLDYDVQQPLSVVETGKDVVEEMSNEISIPTPNPSTGFALATNSSSSTVGSEGPPSVMEPKEDFTQHLN